MPLKKTGGKKWTFNILKIVIKILIPRKNTGLPFMSLMPIKKFFENISIFKQESFTSTYS